MSDQLVTYESNDGIALFTINRADKMNALSNGVVAQLRDHLLDFEASDDRVGIVTGAGDRAFSVGADLKDPPRDPDLWECMPGVGVDRARETMLGTRSSAQHALCSRFVAHGTLLP